MLRPSYLLWFLSVGCAAAPAPPAKAPSAVGKPAAPATEGVRVAALAEVPNFAPPAWAFITADLQRLGQPELVLVVKREPGEADDAYPREGVQIVSSLAAAVKQGRRLTEWEMANIPDGMFGRRDLSGIIFGGPVQDPRLKLTGATMTILIITHEELDVAFHFGPPRVTNMLGHLGQFFPYPPWIDRQRQSVCTPAQVKDSPIAKVAERDWIPGAGVWHDPQTRRVTLTVTREAGKHMAEVLRKTGADPLAYFSMAPPAEADSRLVWTQLGEKPLAITRAQHGGGKMAGTFVILTTADETSGAQLTEDGFSAFVPRGRWGELLTALETGRFFEVTATEGARPFEIVEAPHEGPHRR